MFEEILSCFPVKGKILNVVPYGCGHINSTFLVETEQEKYILQKINTSIFTDPAALMKNIVLVTEHLKKKIQAQGGDPMRETLTVIPTIEGESFYRCSQGNCYRVYRFIEGARSYQIVEKPSHFYCAARSFGRFHNMLADFRAEQLHESIPFFHHTPKRYDALHEAIREDRMGRAQSVQRQIAFALEREEMAGVITRDMESGLLPLRVTHNDTKFNNILIDDETEEGICVVDLDTVMPGTPLCDFGDAIRFGTNPCEEDEHDLSKVMMSLSLFEQFTKGFLEELRDSMTGKEKEYLALSARIMTLECGVRFLTDYLNGDTYFKIHYEDQNLYRTGTQFKLVQDMEEQDAEMQRIVSRYLG